MYLSTIKSCINATLFAVLLFLQPQNTNATQVSTPKEKGEESKRRYTSKKVEYFPHYTKKDKFAWGGYFGTDFEFSLTNVSGASSDLLVTNNPPPKPPYYSFASNFPMYGIDVHLGFESVLMRKTYLAFELNTSFNWNTALNMGTTESVQGMPFYYSSVPLVTIGFTAKVGASFLRERIVTYGMFAFQWVDFGSASFISGSIPNPVDPMGQPLQTSGSVSASVIAIGPGAGILYNVNHRLSIRAEIKFLFGVNNHFNASLGSGVNNPDFQPVNNPANAPVPNAHSDYSAIWISIGPNFRF